MNVCQKYAIFSQLVKEIDGFCEFMKNMFLFNSILCDLQFLIFISLDCRIKLIDH